MDKLNWNKIGLTSLTLALDQGEKMLKETIVTANFQVNRVLTILKTSVGLFIVISGYLITNKPSFQILYLEAVVSLLVLAFLIIKSFKAYSSYKIKPLGNRPFHILNKVNIEYAGDNLDQFLVFNSCRTVDDSIRFNQERNDLRANLIYRVEHQVKWSLIVVIGFPLLSYLAFLFVPELQVQGL